MGGIWSNSRFIIFKYYIVKSAKVEGEYVLGWRGKALSKDVVVTPTHSESLKQTMIG